MAEETQTCALLAAMLGGWGIVLILAVILVLTGTRLPPFTSAHGPRGTGLGVEKPGPAGRSQTETLDSQSEFEWLERVIGCRLRHDKTDSSLPLMQRIALWVAQGFGVGRIPFGPGTWGSLVGVLWFLALVATGNLWALLAGIVLGLALSVWLCGTAERILQRKDPPSVVLDEIAALPLCFVPWVVAHWAKQHALPPPGYFVQHNTWYLTIALFVLFRIFDIAKPWPLKQSQRLPGGWGVTVDDVLAAACVAALSMFVRV